MKRCIFLFTIFCLALPSLAALPVTIQPDNPNIVKMGRFTKDNQFGWTATGFRFKTNATNVEAELKLTATGAGALQVVVDGKPTEVLQLNKKQTVYSLAHDLDAGEHTIEVWKRTEGYLGQVQFVGLKLNAGAKLLPLKPHGRRILVIGDSISCGYGNEAKNSNEGSNTRNQNGYMAYGPIAARALDAEVMLVCASGRGMYRDRGDENDKANTMPKQFDRTLPLSEKDDWDHSQYVPDVIVINLGTNDFYRGKKRDKPALTKEMFFSAYRPFVARLKELYPKANIIVSIGPGAAQSMKTWIMEFAKDNEKVSALIWETPKENWKSYLGGHGHPSVKMNQLMAKELVEEIRKIMGWK